MNGTFRFCCWEETENCHSSFFCPAVMERVTLFLQRTSMVQLSKVKGEKKKGTLTYVKKCRIYEEMDETPNNQICLVYVMLVSVFTLMSRQHNTKKMS